MNKYLPKQLWFGFRPKFRAHFCLYGMIRIECHKLYTKTQKKNNYCFGPSRFSKMSLFCLLLAHLSVRENHCKTKL